MKILITGATGNVGKEVTAQLAGRGHDLYAGSRHGDFPDQTQATPVVVDFATNTAPDEDFDAIFLLRPPQLADPDIFKDFLKRYPRQTRLVFLSVEGAGTKSYLPHAKIEKMITRLGFDCVFIRPGYFMDNLLTTLWPELERNRRIYLPAGKLRLNWVSIRDVATLCARALSRDINDRVVPTVAGTRAGFATVCARINAIAGTDVSYVPASLPGYVIYSRRQGTPWTFIAVMLLLHYLPRFTHRTEAEPHDAAGALSRQPETLDAFIARKKDTFRRLA